MKTKKTIIAAILLLSLFIANKGLCSDKYKGDTLRIRFSDFIIEINATSLVQYSLSSLNLAETAASVSNLLEPVSIPTPESDEIYYISISDVDGKQKLDFKNVTIEKRKKNAKKLVFAQGKVLEKDFGNYVVEVDDINYTLFFYLDNLKDLSKLSGEAFEKQISYAQSLIPDGRKKINGWLKWDGNDNFESHFLSETSPYSLDMIELTAGLGAGVIKNQWANDINFRAGLGFGKKGIMRNNYFAEFKMVYDFSNSGNKLFSINSFLSLGWEHNYSNSPEKAKWVGFSVGYLVDRNTDFFEKNTWKLTLRKNINQTISVNPELYFNEFFKNVYPGIQIGINF